MVRDCANTGPIGPREVLQFGTKRMLRTSVYAYESNEVYFARLCIRLYAYVKKKKYTLALTTWTFDLKPANIENFLNSFLTYAVHMGPDLLNRAN